MSAQTKKNERPIRVAELFAGVGGFRLGLEGYHNSEQPQLDMPAAGPFQTVWANQWEPPGTEARQFAARCYKTHFGDDSLVNEDINKVLDEYEAGERAIPDIDMVVGGFPCQDYSVAKPLSQAGGIEGKKGVLWWDIYRFLRLKNKPRYVLLENVDRLLKSPASQRGRDFAIMLSCFADLDYSVEWRVVNSGEYGFPQRRKRVYIYAMQTEAEWDLEMRLTSGVIASAFPIEAPKRVESFLFRRTPTLPLRRSTWGAKPRPFLNVGRCRRGAWSPGRSARRMPRGWVAWVTCWFPRRMYPSRIILPMASLENGNISRVPSGRSVRIRKRASPTFIQRAPWHFPTRWTSRHEPF